MIFGDKNRFLVLVKTRLAPWIISTIVLLIGLIVTAILWRDAKQLQAENLNKEFLRASDQTAKSILGRLDDYETIMRGVKGYIDGSDKITVNEFHTYVQALQIFEKKSGLMGIDQVELVTQADKAKHISEIRKQGLTDYTIKPEGERDSYAPITLIEPMDSNNLKVIGFDTYSKPATREAMERSRDFGDVAISARLILEPDSAKENIYAFVMCLPIYKAGVTPDNVGARREAIKGWVQTPIRMLDLMAGLQGSFSQDLSVEIYDGKPSDATLMYRNDKISTNSRLTQSMLESNRKLNLGGRVWTLRVNSTPEFTARISSPHQHIIIAITGVTLSFVLAMLAWFLARGRLVARNTYQRLFNQAGEGVLMLSRDHRLLDANPAALRMLGYSRDELLQLNLPKLLAGIEVEKINSTVENMMAGEPHAGEWLHVRKDGTQFLVEVNARRLDNKSYFATLRDLTNRKKNEQRILKLSNLYQALGEINQAIVRMSDERELFPLVCKCAVKFGGMQMAWVGVLDISSNQIFPKASYGIGLGYLENIKISASADVPEGCGPTGIAFRENHYVVINNFLEDPITKPWYAKGKQFGWHSSASFPILRNGKPFAVFTVYSAVVDAFDKEVLDLFNELTSDISFALDNFDREAQRRKAEDKTKIAQISAIESLDRYTDLYEFAPIGYFSINKDATLIEVNWKVTSMFGLKRNQLNQHNLAEFIIDSEKKRWQNLFKEMQELEAGEELNFDLNFMHNNGSVFMANLNCLRMDDELDKPILRVAMLDVTQLKRTEEARQHADVKLQAIIDAIPDLLFELDINGRYYSAHSPSDHLLATAPEELIGKTVDEVLPADAAFVVMSAIHEADNLGRSQGKQFVLELPEGQFWFELSVAKKPKLDDESQRFIFLSRDVTERRHFETKLLDSSIGLAKAQASAHLGSWEVDLTTMIGTWSDENSRLHGRDPALGAPSLAEYIELIHPDDRYIVEDFFKNLPTLKNTIKTELRTNPVKGALRTLSVTINVIRDANGQAIRAIGTSLDISERKQAELEFRIAATAFESQEGMMVTDANKVILRVNKAFTKISGYSAEEAIGQTPRLVSSGHHQAGFYNEMWQSITDNGGWEGEVWNRRKNGEVYPQHLTITAVKGDNGIVTNYVATFTDVTLRNAAEAEINHLAFYDVLTRLPNRRLLIDRLNHTLSTGARLGWGGALLFLDLDHFKTLNDTLGHDVGDMLLRQVAERLTACVREGDTVARLGGDEFVVMLEDLSKQQVEAAAQAEVIAQKILSSVSQPYQLAKNAYQTTASIGVVLFSENEHSQDVLLKHADIAMYQAKKMGRNTLCFFDPNMQEAINTRAMLEVDLRKALESKQFELYYQIQVDRLGQSVGAEALVRWIHPERGLVTPYEFIPLAEETGLILPIGQWVLETACLQLKAWQASQCTKKLTLSINVSAKQFYQTDFSTQVQTAVEQFGINPMQLKLELTESIMLENIETTVIKMKELQKIGVQFSLDDFGTGYSSLQYLKLLPLFQLKIDRSFVRDIAIDSSDQAIVRTVIAMAETLNLDVIAEGVETDEQRELLISCGCNAYQGFLFGRPIPIAQFNLALEAISLK